MNGDILAVSGGNAGVWETDSGFVQPDTVSSPDALEPDINTVGGSGGISGGDASLGGFYDADLGGVPVVIVSDRTLEVDAYAAPSGAMGYQVSEYWLDYFRGVLSNLGDVDYCIYSTRFYNGGSYNSQHFYMFYGDDMGGDTFVPGVYNCFDVYSQNSIYYVDKSEQYFSGVDAGRLVYSNLPGYSDIREGVTHDVAWAVLFFLGFFAVYNVCHDIFDYIMQHIYRR